MNAHRAQMFAIYGPPAFNFQPVVCECQLDLFRIDARQIDLYYERISRFDHIYRRMPVLMSPSLVYHLLKCRMHLPMIPWQLTHRNPLAGFYRNPRIFFFGHIAPHPFDFMNLIGECKGARIE